jgi:hypothetical protein
LETHFQSHGTPSVCRNPQSPSPFSHPDPENPQKSQPSNVVEEEEGEGAEDDDLVSDQSESESESRFETTQSLIRRTGTLPRSGFSRGFDLSGLFEEGGEEVRFVLGEPVSKIISKLEEVAKVVSFTVRNKDCRVSLEGERERERRERREKREERIFFV